MLNKFKGQRNQQAGGNFQQSIFQENLSRVYRAVA